MKTLALVVVCAVVVVGCDNGAKERARAIAIAEQRRQHEEQERARCAEELRREAENAKRAEAERIRKRREQALKIIGHEVAADKEVVRQYKSQILALEENKSAFLDRLNSIDIPSEEIVTNVITICPGKTKRDIRKVKLTEHQKTVRKLMYLYEDNAICQLYDSRTDRSAKKLLDELDKEWRMEENDYNNVTKALQAIDAEETKARDKLSGKFKSERNARVYNNQMRISILKKRRADVIKKIQYHENGKCGISHFKGQSCKCKIGEWKATLDLLAEEINSLQADVIAQKSTAVGLEQGNELDQISSVASRKRAEINQEFTHQSAVLKGIADKYQRLLVEDLLDSIAIRRDYLLSQIEEIVKRNDLKLKYIDGRSELSPEMATSFIETDNRKTMSGLHLVNTEVEEARREKENERLINTIKALNTSTININSK